MTEIRPWAVASFEIESDVVDEMENLDKARQEQPCLS